ncbi:MAG: DUF4389 domain-containing protein [Desulfobacterales bacterium]
MESRQIEYGSRKRIAFRLLYTVFFLIAFEIIKTIVQVCVLFQFVYLFITKTHSEPVRKFSNKASVYAYRLLRYVTLNENRRPFPFSDFPAELEPPEEPVEFP